MPEPYRRATCRKSSRSRTIAVDLGRSICSFNPAVKTRSAESIEIPAALMPVSATRRLKPEFGPLSKWLKRMYCRFYFVPVFSARWVGRGPRSPRSPDVGDFVKLDHPASARFDIEADLLLIRERFIGVESRRSHATASIVRGPPPARIDPRGNRFPKGGSRNRDLLRYRGTHYWRSVTSDYIDG